jgi:hypothetical protein
MLRLTHRTKSKSSNTIPLDIGKATQADAFRTVHTVHPSTGVVHSHLEWVLNVDPDHDGRYKEHVFFLEFTPETIGKMEEALAVAKERFVAPGLPGLPELS